jgi:hypothetical protein
MVSSVPVNLAGESLLLPHPNHDEKNRPSKPRAPPKRLSILGLWSAHAAGVHPLALIRQHAKQQQEAEEPKTKQVDNAKIPTTIEEKVVSRGEEVDVISFPSDVEVVPRPDEEDSLSWDSQDDMNHHSYDAWEILKDEYSPEYGFGFATTTTSTQNIEEKEDATNESSIPSGFAILGTSADDVSARPHVLSPPLLDSLMNFLPENIAGQNYWLRYSLVRDGASLETLKRYVRAADQTIVAIETPTGQVFGAFCVSPWRNHHSFFGSPQGAFVWKMRYSRRTKCASLFEQAKLESEIDVYMATPRDPEQPIQVCRHDILGVGGYDDPDDNILDDDDDDNDEVTAEFLRMRAGFAICIDDYLARGTSSFSATFHNPSLCGKGDQPEIFEIANLEVWSLTPCLDVDTAERLELRKYFVEHNVVGGNSTGSLSASPSGRQRQNSRASFSGSASDFTQDAFFRRVGHDTESERRREHWEYLNLMNADKKKSLGSSPRFP